MKKRIKASDAFAQSTPVFTRKVSFEEAFPEIEDVTMEVEETGEGVYGKSQRVTYRKAHFPGEYVDCSNPICYRGGISIGSILREMVRERKTELVTYRKCRGYEGSPKGRRKYRDCFNSFTVTVSISYKEPEQEGD